MELTRQAAWTLLTEYTSSDNLRKHALAVEAAMRGYARRFGEDEEAWAFVALLHDFDYERWPSLDDHPFKGVEILRARDCPEFVVRAILSHADYSGVPRESQLEHALFACDEMAGFVTAASLVRPSRSVLDLEAASVLKRMKDKAFARGVKREDLRQGAEEIGLSLEEHITNVIAFMRERADELGLRGLAVASSANIRRSPSVYPDEAMAEPATAVVQLEQLTVQLGKNEALRDVTATFPPGAVGLLGPNGAGKSTLLKSLLGFLQPQKGRMHVFGLDVAEQSAQIRARLGYMPETDAHIPGMNAVSFVADRGQLAGLPRVDAMQRAHEVLQYVGLGEVRYRDPDYSAGMKQRVKLAQALVHDPDLLFLDEPTNGLDPQGRDEMLELIHDLGHNKGVNVIVSSHLLPDVEYTCNYVVVLDKGAVAAQGPIEELKGPKGRVYELRLKGDRSRFVDHARQHGLECHATDEDVMRVFVPDGHGPQVIFELAAGQGLQVRHLRPSVPTLEDVFARAVGEE